MLKDIKPEAEHTEEDMDMDIVDTSDCMTCFVLFRKFIKEVTLVNQMDCVGTMNSAKAIANTYIQSSHVFYY